MNCPRCGAETDGAELCVECWDARCEGKLHLRPHKPRQARAQRQGRYQDEAYMEAQRVRARRYYWTHREQQLARSHAWWAANGTAYNAWRRGERQLDMPAASA